MRRLILILPGLHDAKGNESIIRSEISALEMLRDKATVSKVDFVETLGIAESEFLGLERNSVFMEQGPLTVAALGYDPPDRSVHFHLSLLSTENGQIHVPPVQLDRATQSVVLAEAKKLNTRRITVCEGDESDHCLVLEKGSPDIVSYGPILIDGKALREMLPLGDDELDLRRFIDDSVNLLSDQDFNRKRMDDSLPPINLLWPWGGGWRQNVPNLGLRFGEVGYVASNSIRLQGLTRLVGWRHCSRPEFRSGTRINFEYLLNWIRSSELSICFISEFSQFRTFERFEELSWLASEMNRRLLLPLSDDMKNDDFQITVISPSEQVGRSGIAMKSRSGKLADGVAPFDERLLEEKGIPTFSIAETVRRGMVKGE